MNDWPTVAELECGSRNFDLYSSTSNRLLVYFNIHLLSFHLLSFNQSMLWPLLRNNTISSRFASPRIIMGFCNQSQALEAALPETVSELMSLAAVHAEGGPEHRFVARQLLIIASRCVVRSD